MLLFFIVSSLHLTSFFVMNSRKEFVMKIKVRKLFEDAILPEKSEDSVAYDLFTYSPPEEMSHSSSP